MTMRELIKQGSRNLPTGVRHFYNAHFPGLYSIVLEQNGDLLTRAFIAYPNALHHDLRSFTGTFLWHAHGYDFRETSVAGTVENICVRPSSKRNAIVMYRYKIQAGITSNTRPRIERLDMRGFEVFSTCEIPAGGSFFMLSDIIHRVVFQPCRKTGWFCCVVQELRRSEPSNIVYCPDLLIEVPNADALYQELTDEQARAVLTELYESLI